jgi:two-component system, LytTR family, response regulator
MFDPMKKITAILVDDEESARDVLENLLIRFCPNVQLLGKYQNIEQAVEAINKNQPNLVFLDIEMPNYAGYEIINFFDEINFDIIFVSAYDKYAIRAFEVSAVDYLLKPIDIERLKQAVQKSTELIQIKNSAQRFKLLKDTLTENKINSIMISEKSFQYAIDLNDIIAFEAEESYTHVHTIDKKYIVSKNLKHFETILDQNNDFFRVHKSWLINLKHLKNYSKSLLDIKLTNDIVAKLSKLRKAEFEVYILTKRI